LVDHLDPLVGAGPALGKRLRPVKQQRRLPKEFAEAFVLALMKGHRSFISNHRRFLRPVEPVARIPAEQPAWRLPLFAGADFGAPLSCTTFDQCLARGPQRQHGYERLDTRALQFDDGVPHDHAEVDARWRAIGIFAFQVMPQPLGEI
jgi:hypothetical protein